MCFSLFTQSKLGIVPSNYNGHRGVKWFLFVQVCDASPMSQGTVAYVSSHATSFAAIELLLRLSCSHDVDGQPALWFLFLVCQTEMRSS